MLGNSLGSVISGRVRPFCMNYTIEMDERLDPLHLCVYNGRPQGDTLKPLQHYGKNYLLTSTFLIVCIINHYHC